MNKIVKLTFAALMGVTALASCSDDYLETTPSLYLSGDDLYKSAASAQTPLNGIYRSMYTAGWSTTGNSHQCFGISAYNLMAEVMGEDYVMASPGSGWFWYDAVYNVKSRYASGGWRSYDLWSAYYQWINNANSLIAAQNTMTGGEAEVNSVIGQAYAIRAYSYFMLAQTFARTYKGHESEPCVPIYTEPTLAGTEGKPRATVQQVYDQINQDIAKAVSLLKDTEPLESKSQMGYAVAQGIRARIAAVEEDWSTMKEAAQEAIKASGCVVLPVKDFLGENNVEKNNVMWGAKIIGDQVGSYASFFAQVDPNGPYGGRSLKKINAKLYDTMGENDTRREWWDSETKVQHKMFFSNRSTWEGDYVWMRVEEMYLTLAEAECRLGNEAEAIKILEELVKTRDADYTAAGKTGTELGKTSNEETGSLLEEIIRQRRIELWGEAGRVYDLRRLKQGFRRTAEQGWPTSALLANRPTDNTENYMWVLTIPQAEFDGNVNMNADTDQNPMTDLFPMPEEEKK